MLIVVPITQSIIAAVALSITTPVLVWLGVGLAWVAGASWGAIGRRPWLVWVEGAVARAGGGLLRLVGGTWCRRVVGWGMAHGLRLLKEELKRVEEKAEGWRAAVEEMENSWREWAAAPVEVAAPVPPAELEAAEAAEEGRAGRAHQD